MQITRSVIDTRTGPREWFTGTVHIDEIAAPSPPGRLRCFSVHFSPGARTAWHRHPLGQTIFVTEGVGYAQSRGWPLEIIPDKNSAVATSGMDSGPPDARASRSAWRTTSSSVVRPFFLKWLG